MKEMRLRTMKKDPKGPENGTQPVVRGGSWLDRADECRAARRSASLPNSASKRFGFRVVFVAPVKVP